MAKGGTIPPPPPQIKPWLFNDVSTECFSHHMVESLKNSVALTAYVNSGTSHSIIFWYHTVLMIQDGPSSLQCKTYMRVYIWGFCLLLTQSHGITMNQLGSFSRYYFGMSSWALSVVLPRIRQHQPLAWYLGLLAPAFVTCSTNTGEGLVKLSHVVWRTWTHGGVAHSQKNSK